ncbi:MAG: sigma-70 family RNA polymerase sigma factor [Phycisphaerae bacterium]
MDEAELADVIARARRQEPAAFDTLISAYSDRLYGFFYRLTGSRHDAEDLLQEVFIRVVRTIGRYEHAGRFDGWLFRIAANLLRDRVRRSRRGKPSDDHTGERVGPEPAESLANRPDPAQDDPASALQRAEATDRLQRAIDRLPPAEREVIMLRHFSQLPFREIAEMMDTPLGTALARAHRGLARLRELMEAPPGPDELERRAGETKRESLERQATHE